MNTTINTTINRTKSKIRIKRNTLRVDSVHAEVELWGILSQDQHSTKARARLLNFGSNTNQPGCFLAYATAPSQPEIISDEALSVLIWSLPIVADDNIQLSTEDVNKVYEQIVQAKKMFLPVTGLTLA